MNANCDDPINCKAEPCHDDKAYQAFIESMAQYCRCEHPHPCPCDGVLAGGLCDGMTNEPDYTLDDLDWSEEND